MVARANRQEAVLIAAALAGALACKPAGPNRPERVSAWLLVEHLEPRLEVPHVLKLGPEERVLALRGGEWREIYEGPPAGAIALAGGSAVLIRVLGEIHAADGSVVKLSASACPRAWRGHVAVLRPLERVICMKVEMKNGACAQVEVAQFDASGRLLRADALGTDAVCADTSESFGGGSSHLLAGVTHGGDPVVAVRVSPLGGRPEYAVVTLAPGGAHVVGRFTPMDEKAAIWAVDVESHAPGLALTPPNW